MEDNNDIHLGRLLLLIDTFTNHNENETVNGLTKLAKLDFLLRYPVYLEKALQANNVSPKGVALLDYERKSVESSMVRYRYGPWDYRYRRFINILVAKGLVTVCLEGRTIKIGLTKVGIDKALALSVDSNYEDIVSRANIIHKHFDIGATRLKNFVYETFPEIGTLRLGERIKP